LQTQTKFIILIKFMKELTPINRQIVDFITGLNKIRFMPKISSKLDKKEYRDVQPPLTVMRPLRPTFKINKFPTPVLAPDEEKVTK
jgi:hypothetical protein